jgi:hypothetical protein
MSAIIIDGRTPFGGMSNAAISNLIKAIRDIHRVNLAQAAAQSGAPSPTAAALETGSNFGVAVSGAAGAKGADFAFAVATLDTALQAFLAANQGAITALDNGD